MKHEASLPKVIIYTDGACSGNPGPGGWGVLLLFNGARVKINSNNLKNWYNKQTASILNISKCTNNSATTSAVYNELQELPLVVCNKQVKDQSIIRMLVSLPQQGQQEQRLKEEEYNNSLKYLIHKSKIVEGFLGEMKSSSVPYSDVREKRKQVSVTKSPTRLIYTGNLKQKSIFGYKLHTTNNRMEITAAIEALRILKKSCYVELYTDSKYLQFGITQWIHTWIKNNWHKNNNNPIKNVDLWKKLYKELSKHYISWNWVKGHDNNEGNQIADRLALKGKEIAIKILKCNS